LTAIANSGHGVPFQGAVIQAFETNRHQQSGTPSASDIPKSRRSFDVGDQVDYLFHAHFALIRIVLRGTGRGG
jgi:hypothetical protein